MQRNVRGVRQRGSAERMEVFFDACVARLYAAIEYAENSDVEPRFRGAALVEYLWLRSARDRPRGQRTPGSSRVLLVATGGYPVAGWHICMNRDALDRTMNERDPQPLLHMALAIEMAVADLAALPAGTSAMIGYTERGNRVFSTLGASLRSGLDSRAPAWWEVLSERLSGLALASAAVGSIYGARMAMMATHIAHNATNVS
jgi:hypothetical protein